jgi:predicted nucleic acid-binding protein
LSARTFIDSNVLLYAIDDEDPIKRTVSRTVLRQLMESQNGVVSTQVLQEFAAVATRKFGISPTQAKAALRSWAALDTVLLTTGVIYDAIDEMTLSRLSFWDSLIIAAAASAHCTELLTEDLQPGQTIRGVTVHNPFA